MYEHIYKLIQLDKHEEAITRAQALMAEDPDDAWALSLLGMARWCQGYRYDGRKHMEAAIALEPDEAFFYRLLGICRLEEDRLDKAEQALNRAIELCPTDIETCYQLGRLEVTRRKAEEALHWAELAAEHEPDPRVLSLLGLCLALNGRPAEGRQALDRALQMNPGIYIVQRHACLFHLHSRDIPAALIHMREAITLNPHDEYLRTLLAAFEITGPLAGYYYRWGPWLRRRAGGLMLVAIGFSLMYAVAALWASLAQNLARFLILDIFLLIGLIIGVDLFQALMLMTHPVGREIVLRTRFYLNLRHVLQVVFWFALGVWWLTGVPDSLLGWLFGLALCFVSMLLSMRLYRQPGEPTEPF